MQMDTEMEIQLPVRYKSGCKCIDELLGGGFESGTVTQLYGEAGSGKTNICLQTAIECARKGKTVIFIDSEGFSPERFIQIARSVSDERDIERIARRIIIYEPQSFEQQTACIKEVEGVIEEKKDVALVILDSATLFYRLELDEERSMYLRRVLANQIEQLLMLARRYDLAVIITNQVYSDIEEGKGKLRPSGGYALEHLSKVIVQLEKSPQGRGKRRATIKKHRSMPEDITCEFFITGGGVE